MNERITLLKDYFIDNRAKLNLSEIENMAGVEHGTVTKVIFGYEIEPADLSSLETVVRMIENGELQNCLI